ncbi:MAG: hypothetical protein ACFE9S_05750 [Candidatus Hermodarchaeota archaeon]
MEEINKFEKIAEENANLARIERDTASEMKSLAKQSVKRAKAREMLARNELEVAKVRERLADKSKKLVERKEKMKDYLKIGEDILKAERIQTQYNQNVAEIQTEIAEIQKEIAKIEKDITEIKVKIANKKLDEAKERGNLANKIRDYVKLMNANAPSDKISRAEEAYLNVQKLLTKLETDALELNKNIVKKQNKLADLKKDHSDKLAEREKIRPN